MTGSAIQQEASYVPQQIVVLGMHRSGTSALAGALAAMGVFVGDESELTTPLEENPRGFFERKDARRLCDGLLHDSDADWWKISRFDPSRIEPDVRERYRLGLEALINTLNKRGNWALKEPRLCLLYPLLQPTLERPLLLLMVRHPLEVARSLRERNDIPMRASLALWEAYTIAAMRHARAERHRIVHHSSLLSSPETTLDRHATWLKEQGLTGLDVAAGVASIDPSLHRQQFDEDDAVWLSPAQERLWRLLSDARAVDEVPAVSHQAWATLGEFEVDYAERLENWRVIAELRRELKSIQSKWGKQPIPDDALQTRLEQAEARLNEQEKALRRQKETIAEQRREIADHDRRLKWRAEKIQQLEKEAAAQHVNLAKEKEKLIERHEKKLMIQITAASERASRLERQRDERTAQLSVLLVQWQQLRDQMANEQAGLFELVRVASRKAGAGEPVVDELTPLLETLRQHNTWRPELTGLNWREPVMVSVILVPGRNDLDESVRAALERLQEQSWPLWELLIVYDAAAPADWNTMIPESESRVRLVPSLEFADPWMARNAGVRAAQGSLVSFLEHETLWHNDYLAAVVRAFQQTPSVWLAAVWPDQAPFLAHAEDAPCPTQTLPAAGGTALRRPVGQVLQGFTSGSPAIVLSDWLLSHGRSATVSLPAELCRYSDPAEEREVTLQRLVEHERALYCEPSRLDANWQPVSSSVVLMSDFNNETQSVLSRWLEALSWTERISLVFCCDEEIRASAEGFLKETDSEGAVITHTDLLEPPESMIRLLSGASDRLVIARGCRPEAYALGWLVHFQSAAGTLMFPDAAWLGALGDGNGARAVLEDQVKIRLAELDESVGHVRPGMLLVPERAFNEPVERLRERLAVYEGVVVGGAGLHPAAEHFCRWFGQWRGRGRDGDKGAFGGQMTQ